MSALVYLLDMALNIYMMIIVVQVALGWLIAFEVINVSNPQARNLINLLHRATEPVYKPIRKYVPPIGGIDLTPLIVIIGLSFFGNILINALLAL